MFLYWKVVFLINPYDLQNNYMKVSFIFSGLKSLLRTKFSFCEVYKSKLFLNSCKWFDIMFRIIRLYIGLFISPWIYTQMSNNNTMKYCWVAWVYIYHHLSHSPLHQFHIISHRFLIRFTKLYGMMWMHFPFQYLCRVWV